MNRLYVILSIATLACCLVFSNSMTAQTSAYSPKVLPPAPKSARVQITQGPELELANDKSAIIRWTSNNLGARTSISESCISVRIPRRLARQRSLLSG